MVYDYDLLDGIFFHAPCSYLIIIKIWYAYTCMYICIHKGERKHILEFLSGGKGCFVYANLGHNLLYSSYSLAQIDWFSIDFDGIKCVEFFGVEFVNKKRFNCWTCWSMKYDMTDLSLLGWIE